MTSTQGCSSRILLVDDETDLVEFLARRLLRRGCTVTATNSGHEAIEAVKAQTFDIAILDLNMPEMDGLEVLERIRTIQPYLEVIMLTGHGSPNSALQAGRLQAYRYLLKPCGIEDLMAQIQDASEHREKVLETAYMSELEKLMAPGHTPRDIMARSEELRRKYHRD